MKPSADGVIREAWPPLAFADIDNRKAAPTPPQATRKDHEAYAAEWETWLERRADEAAEAEGEEEAASVDPLLSEGLAALQLATDRAIASLEHRFTSENEALRTLVAKLETARAADQERHNAEIRGLRTKLREQAKDHASEIERWRGEIVLVAK